MNFKQRKNLITNNLELLVNGNITDTSYDVQNLIDESLYTYTWFGNYMTRANMDNIYDDFIYYTSQDLLEAIN